MAITIASILKISDPNAAISLASAGAIVVALTTTLVNAFAFPAAITALGISLIMSVGMLGLSKKEIVNIILVSLVIFHLARGGNVTLAKGEDYLTKEEPVATQTTFFNPSDIFCTPAYADEIYQATTNTVVTTNAPPVPPKNKTFKAW